MNRNEVALPVKIVSTFGQKTYLDLNQVILNSVYGLKAILQNLQKRKSGAILTAKFNRKMNVLRKARAEISELASSERGDVPGWVLVVLMTTGLVTGIWTVAQPRLSSILKNSLDNMNSIR